MKTLVIWDQFFLKVISAPKTKNEHHHRILHIQDSLSIKFQLK